MRLPGEERVDLGTRTPGLLYRAAGGNDVAAVVCHPHPQQGGRLDNVVVSAMCEALHGKWDQKAGSRYNQLRKSLQALYTIVEA